MNKTQEERITELEMKLANTRKALGLLIGASYTQLGEKGCQNLISILMDEAEGK